jgi:MFS family permease
VKREQLRLLFAPYRVLGRNRDLRLLFFAHTSSRLVQWLYLITLFILAYQISHSALTVALLTFVRLLPNALMLPISGALTDRWSARWLMVTSLIGRALCMIGLLFVTSQATLPLAYPTLFAATILSALFRPALVSMLPDVVEERRILEANSLMTQAEMVSQGLGPVLSGALVLTGNLHVAFLLSALTFILGAGAIVFVHPAHRAQDLDDAPDREGWLLHTTRGFHFLIHEHDHVLLAFAVALAGMAVLNGANYTLTVVLSQKSFGLGAQGAGFLNGVYGLGGLVGGLLIVPLVGARRIAPFFLIAAGADCLASILYGFSPHGPAPFALLGAVGFTDIVTRVAALTVIQIAVPRALLGRAFAAFESALLMAQVVGTLAVGPLIASEGPRLANFWLATVGVVTLAITAPRILQLEDVLGVRIFLRRVPILNPVSLTLLDDLASRVALERVPPDTEIIREGDHGDRFYIVKRGRVEVMARGGRERAAHIAELSRMDYFGEIALLRDVPRTATVRSRGLVELYSLSRHDFQELLQRSREFHDALHGVSAFRNVDLQNKLLLGY